MWISTKHFAKNLRPNWLLTAAQLAKEFWIPLSLALPWGFYSYSGLPLEDRNLKNFINIFGPAFFLVSWLLGQIFRVAKQQRVEGGLDSIESNIKKLLRELDERTRALEGFITGGTSICHAGFVAEFDRPFETYKRIVFFQQGEHPLYDVEVRIVDLDDFSKALANNDMSAVFASDRHIEIKGLIPNTSREYLLSPPISMGDGNSRSFNIFYMARNGTFTQAVRFAKVDGQWLYATRVHRPTGEQIVPLYESVPENFPLNADGVVDWYGTVKR